MPDAARRKELQVEYREAPREAGVYRIVNQFTGNGIVASTANLASIRNKLEFAQTTNSPTVLDGRLAREIREYGILAFELEVLEVVEPRPDQTRTQLLADLATLEKLWREKIEAGAVS